MGMSQLLTVSATTSRQHIHGGRRIEPEAYLTGLLCAPIMPVGAEARNGPPTETPAQQWETFLADAPDIVQGDWFITGGTTYSVVAVALWPWPGSAQYTRIVIEELRDGSRSS